MSRSIALSSITDGDTYLSESARDLASPALDGPTLYGRDQEVHLLLEAYQGVCRNGTSEITLIHGLAGSGKTSLVDTLREVVCDTDGYFCVGKFVQQSGAQEPYSAIMTAFSDLCDLISQSNDFAERKKYIQQNLGDNIQLLSRTISGLAPFLDGLDSAELFDLQTETSFSKFKVACKAFLRAMSCSKHPIVFVLDDVQWMDEGSMQVVRLLLEAADLTSVLLVILYREEDKEQTVKLLGGHTEKNYLDITIGSLNHDAIHEMVSVFLDTTSVPREFSHIVLQRSMGNAFHVLRFVEMLFDEGLLIFDSSTEAWVFDVENIRRQTMVADKSAIMLLRNKRLPQNVQDTLKVASVVGYHFDESVIIEVMRSSQGMDLFMTNNIALSHENSTQTIHELLTVASDALLIEKTSEGYQFSHDMIQSSFQSTIDGETEQLLHKLIGEAFLKSDSSWSTYHASVHLNQAIALMNDKASQVKLARINLDAAKQCNGVSAFQKAAVLLTKAITLIPASERWTDYYSHTLEAVALLAKMNLATGNFTSCRKRADDIIENATSTPDKLDSLDMKLGSWVAENNKKKIIETGAESLRILGVVNISKRISLIGVASKFLKVKRLLRGKSNESILELPPMEDEVMSMTVIVLIRLAGAYLVEKESAHGIYCALLGIELSLVYGLTPVTAGAFAIFAIIEYGRGSYRSAERFGDLALSLLQRFPCLELDASTIVVVTTFISHWNHPLECLMNSMDAAVSKCFASGYLVPDIASAEWFRLRLGVNLAEHEQHCRQLYSQLSDMNQEAVKEWFQPTIQFIVNMQRQTPDSWLELTQLNGQIMTESVYLRHAIEAKMITLLMIFYTHKLELSYYFGYYSTAQSTLKNINELTGKDLDCHFFYWWWQFIGGLTYYELYRSRRQRTLLTKGRKCTHILQRLARVHPAPTCRALSILLVAENKSIRKRSSVVSVQRAYDASIQAMVNAKFFHLEALANERAGMVLFERGCHELAETYLFRAMELYRDDWGAIAKYEWLEEKVNSLFLPLERARMGQDTTAPIPGEVVDVAEYSKREMETDLMDKT